MTGQKLPKSFSELAPFVAQGWALATERERVAKRCSSTMEELTEFYDAVLPKVDEIMTYLDALPQNDLPEDAQRLLDLTFSLAEASMSVERYQQPGVVDGFDPERFLPFSPFGQVP